MKETLSEDRLVFWDLKAEGLRPIIAPSEDLKADTPHDDKNLAPLASAPDQVVTSDQQAKAEVAAMPAVPVQASGDKSAEVSADKAHLRQEQSLERVMTNEPVGGSRSQNTIYEGAVTDQVTHKPDAVSESGAERSAGATIKGWHLRKKRADIFIDQSSQVPYLEPLCSYLKSKGISILAYDPKLHYLSYDVILADKSRLGVEGRRMPLDDGKGKVWEFLKQVFGVRLS